MHPLVRHLRVWIAAASLGSTSTACDSPRNSPGSDSDWEPAAVTAKADGLDVLAPDVAILSAYVGGPEGGEEALVDPADCIRKNGGFSDCTRALELATGLPSLHPVVVDRRQGAKFDCKLLRVQAVTPLAPPAIAGIGFWYRGPADPPVGHRKFIGLESLHPTEDVSLTGGTPATVYEFVGVAQCWQGTTWETHTAHYQFQPYVSDTFAPQFAPDLHPELAFVQLGDGVDKIDNSMVLLQ